MVSIVECNEICSVWTRMVKLSLSVQQCNRTMLLSDDTIFRLEAVKRLYIKIRIQCTMWDAHTHG